MCCCFSSFCKMEFSCPGWWQLHLEPREPPLQRNPPMWRWEMCMVHRMGMTDQRWIGRVMGKIITSSATASRHCAPRAFENSSARAFSTIQEQFSAFLVKWTKIMSSISVSCSWLKPTTSTQITESHKERSCREHISPSFMHFQSLFHQY